MQSQGKLRVFRLTLMGLMFVVLLSCGDERIELRYKDVNYRISTVIHASNDIPAVNYAVKAHNNIFAANKNIWKIDLSTGNEAIFIYKGIGPNEIVKPKRVVLFKDYIWINTWYDNRYIYRFSTKSPTLKLESIEFNRPYVCDDFEPLSDTKVAMVYAYWKEELLRIYNLENEEIKRCGKPDFIEIMNKFNVNNASIAVLNDIAYVIQSIKPEIQVFSLVDSTKIETIILDPPFFKKIPDKYEVNKFDRDAHYDWMSGWTRLVDIFAHGKWLLIKYRKGYENKYYYELINLDNKKERLFITETPDSIFDFKVKDKNVLVETYEQTEEKIIWKKAEILL